jgi:hypothetical protein
VEQVALVVEMGEAHSSLCGFCVFSESRVRSLSPFPWYGMGHFGFLFLFEGLHEGMQ